MRRINPMVQINYDKLKNYTKRDEFVKKNEDKINKVLLDICMTQKEPVNDLPLYLKQTKDKLIDDLIANPKLKSQLFRGVGSRKKKSPKSNNNNGSSGDSGKGSNGKPNNGKQPNKNGNNPKNNNQQNHNSNH